MKPCQIFSLAQLLLAALCGAVLAVHRRIAGSGSSMAVACVVVIAILSAVSLVSFVQEKKQDWQRPAIGKVSFALLAAAGFLYLAGAAGFLLSPDGSLLLRATTGVLCALCGAATLARLSSRDEGRVAAVLSLAPILLQSYLLLSVYRSNADNPYLIQFGYDIFVLLMALLGVYAAAAGRFVKKDRWIRRLYLCAGIGLTVQELLLFLLQPQQLLSVQGLSWGVPAMLLASGLLMVNRLMYPQAFDPELAGTAEKPDRSDDDGSDGDPVDSDDAQ